MSKNKLNLSQKEQQLIITALEYILVIATIGMALAVLISRGVMRFDL